MEAKTILQYLRRQIETMAEGEAKTPGKLRGFIGKSWLADREILALLALATMRPEFPLRQRLATPLEAVSRLSWEDRTSLCDEFRERLSSGGPFEAQFPGGMDGVPSPQGA